MIQKKILDIKKLIFLISRIQIFTSKNQFLILKKNFEFITCISKLIFLIAINNLFSWYQEFWFFIIRKSIFDITNSNSWYQQMNFWYKKWFVFPDIRKYILWYQEISLNFRYQKNHFWYQKIDSMISENDFFISGIWMISENVLYFLYQECEFLTSKIIFWYLKIFFLIFARLEFMKSEIGCLISENRFLDIRKNRYYWISSKIQISDIKKSCSDIKKSLSDIKKWNFWYKKIFWYQKIPQKYENGISLSNNIFAKIWLSLNFPLKFIQYFGFSYIQCRIFYFWSILWYQEIIFWYKIKF